MRITRDTLLKVARDTVTQRTRQGRGILAAYLCGSLLDDEFLLGGTADVDLVFIHLDSVELEREILRLTDEVHLDIAHHLEAHYRKTRQLRIHPWLGPTLNSCTVLHDPRHFLDFTQASVRGQFDQPDFTLKRASMQIENARQIWLGFQMEVIEPGPEDILAYLRAVGHTANAVASLSGPPLTERRFLLQFPGRAQAVDRPGLYPGLLGLLGVPNLAPDWFARYLPAWGSAYDAVSKLEPPARLHPDRRLYYQSAFEAMAGGAQPEAVLWPLLQTWTMAAQLTAVGSEEYETWRGTLEQMRLLGEAFMERVAALDAYLDLAEDTLEIWARQSGVWMSSRSLLE